MLAQGVVQQPRLAGSGLANDRGHPRMAAAGLIPGVQKDTQFLRAPDQTAQLCCGTRLPPADRSCAMKREQLRRLIDAAERGSERSGFKASSEQLKSVAGNDRPAGRRDGFQSLGDVNDSPGG